MSTQIILNLPDETYERAAQYATYANRDLSEIIAAARTSTLPSQEAMHQLQAISRLPDQEVLALAELRMEPVADRRLSELLGRTSRERRKGS